MTQSSNDPQRVLIDALRQSEARYRHIVDTTNEGIWHIDLQGRTVFANHRMAELLGYSLDELAHLTMYDVTPPHMQSEARAHLDDRMHGVGKQHDWCFTRKDGSLLWCIVSGAPLKNDSGVIVGALGMITDITARKLAEDRVRNLSRLYAVASSVNEAIVRVREPQRLYELACRIAVEQGELPMAWIAMRESTTTPMYLAASCGGSEQFVADVMQRVNSAATSPGPAGRAARDGVAAVSNDITDDATFFFKAEALALGMRSCAVCPMNISGETLGILAVYSAQSHYFRDDELRVLTALADNISFAVESAAKEQARKQALDALQESQRALAALLGNVPGMVYRCRNDANWTIEFASDGCMTLTGYAPERFYRDELISYEQLIVPDDREAVRQAVITGVHEHAPYEMVYRIVGADGQLKWVWERGRGVYNEQGELRFLEGYITDITQRKLLEARVLDAQRMESIGAFAAGVAHDFNNLLMAITGNAQLALSDLDAAHPLHVHVHQIERASLRAADLVRQILTFSRQQRVGREWLRLPETLNAMLNALSADMPSRIVLHRKIDATAPVIAVDPAQLQQALRTLIANAVDALQDKNGEIEVTLDVTTLDELSHANILKLPADLPASLYARIAVRDNGVGMAPSVQARIFEPFFTTKPPGQGTGLGLSAVYGIVRSHEGGITVQSEVNRGATIALLFPITDAAAAPAIKAPYANAADAMGSGQRVLYVDDEEALVFLTTRVLERLGYRVMGYVDASQALQDFRADPHGFDAVVSDLSMPGMSGVEFARELKLIRPDLPIVMTSGYIRDEDLEIARELGIRDLVLKPNTVDELGVVLHRILTPAI